MFEFLPGRGIADEPVGPNVVSPAVSHLLSTGSRRSGSVSASDEITGHQEQSASNQNHPRPYLPSHTDFECRF
jgi:hypothetical protein